MFVNLIQQTSIQKWEYANLERYAGAWAYGLQTGLQYSRVSEFAI